MHSYQRAKQKNGGGPLIMRKTCACGRPMGPTGECADCRRRSLAGAAKRESSAPEERSPEFDRSKASAADEGIRFFAGRKTVCLAPGGLQITLGSAQNDDNAALGQIDISYKGIGRTRYIDESGTARLFARGKRIKSSDKKTCDCDCMMYRQFLRGVAQVRQADQAEFQPVTQITSGKYTRTLDGSWFEEDVSTICKNPLHGCDRGPCVDKPGITENATPGTGVAIRYNFLMQVWDRCRQKAVEEQKHTLTILGDESPRAIEWRDGWLSLQALNSPLSRAIRFLSSGALFETLGEAF